MNSLSVFRDALRAFNNAREWSQFHSPKNLATALVIEAAEVAEHFRWLTEFESRTLPYVTRDAVAEEIADVLIFLVILADKLGIDLEQSAWSKIQKNDEKYPVEKARGVMP
jgi:NTP pyrophosphatase (non-canonical NTP hydrolase)